MCHRRIAAIVLAVALSAGCSSEAAAPGTDVALAPAPLRIPYQVFGTPGPWWRDNATHAEFDRESGECVKESGAARAQAENGSEAAYLAFIECMKTRGWNRGSS